MRPAAHRRNHPARCRQLDYATNFSDARRLQFASRLGESPAISIASLHNSGSRSADTALKIALAYQKARGKPGKYRLIGRERGYHGTNFGGISVGGIVRNRMTYGPMVAGVDHLPHTLDIARNAFSRGEPPHGIEYADALERIVQLHDASTIAAVVVGPSPAPPVSSCRRKAT
jgi:beta-alanine--pyruvate transaminase